MENKASQDKLVESGSKSLEEHKEEFDWLNKNVQILIRMSYLTNIV